jgi:hypothetical protein
MLFPGLRSLPSIDEQVLCARPPPPRTKEFLKMALSFITLVVPL